MKVNVCRQIRDKIISAISMASRRTRWVFDKSNWSPTVDDLCLALSSLQLEEKERVLKYAFFKDAAGTLAGRLMMRKFVSETVGLPWDQITLERGSNDKPCYFANPAVQFNVSHQGNLTVLAGELGGPQVGVDIMEMKYTGGKPLQEFFRIMYRQLTDQEWETVKVSSLESAQEKTFFRIWCLKESFIKATGVGLNIPLRDIDFKINSKLKTVGEYVLDTEVFLEGKKQEEWQFQEVLLRENYCVCVAIHCSAADLYKYPPLPFTPLTFSHLIDSCKPIIPADRIASEELFKKFVSERSGV